MLSLIAGANEMIYGGDGYGPSTPGDLTFLILLVVISAAIVAFCVYVTLWDRRQNHTRADD
jgi:hypothetical protein